MKAKTKVLIGVSAIVGLIGLALATPIVKLASPILSSGTVPGEIETHGKYVTTTGSTYRVSLETEGPSTIATQIASFAVGGHNGWHKHAGMVAVTVTQGQIQWFDENCNMTTYNAGDSWTEGDKVHSFRNSGTVPVQLTATYIIAQGVALRLDDAVPPACAAALGLT